MSKPSLKTPKISMQVLLIILLGFIVAIGVFQFITKDYVEVLVPKEKIEARTKVSLDQFTTKTVDKNSVPANVYLKGQESEIDGKITATTLIPDMPVTADHFLGKDVKSSLTAAAPEGKVLVTVPMDNVKAVSKNISTSDRVNIYASMSNDTIGTLTKLIFQNVQVVDVEKGDDGVTSVTVAVTPEESEELVYAQTVGEIQLAVVPYDYEEAQTNGTSDLQFIQKYLNNSGVSAETGPLTPPNGEEDKESKNGNEE